MKERLHQLLQEAKILQEQQLYASSIILLTLCIELMGACLDDKPVKSPKQSKKRFQVAIHTLLGGNYAALDRKISLYDKWRNQWIHALSPSSLFLITTDISKPHLSFTEKKQIIFNPVVFYNDMLAAFDKLNKKSKIK
jgi:hypothetical protein